MDLILTGVDVLCVGLGWLGRVKLGRVELGVFAFKRQ